MELLPEILRSYLILRPVLLGCLLLAGCRSSVEPEKKEQAPAAHFSVKDGATLQGRVLFTGRAPARMKIDMSANPACERQHHKPVLTESVIVNGNGTLRNTFVWVKSGLPKSHGWIGSVGSSPHLDQDGCVYEPHVLGVMVGQPLEITNSDPVNHNVHAEAVVNAAWNQTQPPRAEKKIRTFDKEEVLFPVTCGLHPWMRAYIGVVSHPFFAVTGADGSFSIEGLPPGSYVLEAVHEMYGRQERPIVVSAGERKQVEFTYAGL